METSSPTHRCPKCQGILDPDFHGGLCPHCLIADLPWEKTKSRTPGFGPRPTKEALTLALPQFENWEEIGQGGMGFVYKARQPHLDRTVAIKVLPIDEGIESEWASRFQWEAKTLAGLNHPHIVTIHDYGQSGGLLYLVMEYVEGCNLREVLLAGRMPAKEALRLIPSLCEALQYAHDRGVIHCDIKPENLLLDKQGRIKIADFGIARIVGKTKENGATQSGDKGIIGTPGYMAPEQSTLNNTQDHRVDIYSMGVVFYEMLTGKRPEEPIELPAKSLGLDLRLDEVILRAMATSPEMRWRSAMDMGTTIRLIGEMAKDRIPLAGHDSTQTKQGYHLPGWLACLLFLLGTVCTLAFAWPHFSEEPFQKAVRSYGPSPSEAWMREFISLSSGGGRGGELLPFKKSWLSCLFGLSGPVLWILLLWGSIQKTAKGNEIRTGNWKGITRIGLITFAVGLFTTHLGLLVTALFYLLLGSGPDILTSIPIYLFGPLLALATLHFRQIGSRQPKSVLRNTVAKPRWSIKALVGAFLIPSMGLVFFLSALVVRAGVSTNSHPGEPAPRGIGIIWISIYRIVFGLAVPLLSTLLGALAIGDIKKGAGRLKGLRLAFFDLLFFPMVVVLSLTWWVIAYTLGTFRDTIARRSAEKWNFLEGLIIYHETFVFVLVFLFATFFILIFVIRKAKAVRSTIRKSFVAPYHAPFPNRSLGLVLFLGFTFSLLLFVFLMVFTLVWSYAGARHQPTQTIDLVTQP